MRKALLILLVLQTIAAGTSACDVCSCSSGGSYYGILPQFQKHFIGVRWTGRSFTSHHPPSNIADQIALPPSEENFNTVELWGRFYPVKRVQVFAFLPYNIFNKNENGNTTTVNGLGDAMLLANYAVINTGDSMFKKVKHTLLLGGGAKFPTGKYNADKEGIELNPNLQTGTGSFDFILNTNYTLRYNKAGMNAEFSYRLNTANKNDYRFGDKLNASLRFFTWLKTKSVSFLPNIGATFEHSEKDLKSNVREYYSGGNVVYGTAGIETYLKRFNIGFTFQQPLYRNQNEGLVKAKQRYTANLTFMF
jgi:hypothetical protein